MTEIFAGLRENKLKKRYGNYDLLRILSTFAVIMIHVNATIANENNVSMTDANFCNFVNVITRFSVPSFVMLSGAFLLQNEANADYKYFYSKSFYKIGVPFIIFLLLITILAEVSSISAGSGFLNPIISLINGTIDNYWFMFMLFGLYFLVPIIIRIKKSISNKCFCIGSFVWCLFAVISQATSTYNVSYSFGVVFSFVGFFLVGNVIRENMSDRKHPCIYFFLSFLLFIIVFILRSVTKYSKFTVNAYLSWFSPLILLASILLFIGFSNINIKINLQKFSSYTYIMYLLHTKVYLLIIKVFDKLIPPFRDSTEIFVVMVTISTFVISLICAAIYNKLWKYFENKYNWKNKWIEITKQSN